MSLVNEILSKLDSENKISFDLEISGGMVSENFKSNFPVGQGMILLAVLMALRGLKKPRPIDLIVEPVSKVISHLYPNLIRDQYQLMNSLLFRKNIVDSLILAEIVGLLDNVEAKKGHFVISKKGRDFIKQKLKEPTEAGLLIRRLDDKAKFIKHLPEDNL